MLTTVQRIQAILAIVLGLLGLPQAGWVAYDLFIGGGRFETLSFLVQDFGQYPTFIGAVDLVGLIWRILTLILMLLVGLVTSAGAVVGGGVALSGRLLFLRYAALACFLHVALVEAFGQGVNWSLAVGNIVQYPPGVTELPAVVGFQLYYWLIPIGLAILRLAFWEWTWLSARAQPVTAEDVRSM